MEEAIGKEGYGWNCICDRENIVELEWTFSWFMVGLQFKWFWNDQTRNPLFGSRENVQKDEERSREKIKKQTSCMCHKEACQRAL